MTVFGEVKVVHSVALSKLAQAHGTKRINRTSWYAPLFHHFILTIVFCDCSVAKTSVLNSRPNDAIKSTATKLFMYFFA